MKFNCLISECNRQSEVIRLLEEHQNSSSTESEETYYDDYETEDPNCTCDSGHTHEHQVSTMGSELLWKIPHFLSTHNVECINDKYGILLTSRLFVIKDVFNFSIWAN